VVTTQESDYGLGEHRFPFPFKIQTQAFIVMLVFSNVQT